MVKPYRNRYSPEEQETIRDELQVGVPICDIMSRHDVAAGSYDKFLKYAQDLTGNKNILAEADINDNAVRTTLEDLAREIISQLISSRQLIKKKDEIIQALEDEVRYYRVKTRKRSMEVLKTLDEMVCSKREATNESGTRTRDATGKHRDESGGKNNGSKEG